MSAASSLSAQPLLARQPVAFLTCHDKARLVSEALAALGFAVEPLNTYDTDHFGTFSRETPRRGSAHDTALAKAQLSASLAGSRYGLGSEGSFARDPHVGWLPWDYEVLCLWDAERQYSVFAMAGSGATNYAQSEIDSLPAAEAFMRKAQFPQHALILGRPGEPWFRKGIRQRDWLIGQLEWVLAREPNVWLETDMRAHMNPLRQVVIREAAAALARHLASLCPSCQAPGFAIVRSEPGLLCSDCGLGTPLPAAQHWGCPACGHEVRRSLPQLASPSHCAYCNP
ncbi:hypothetical protein L1F06_013775 [Ectopseudomonas hydrolytica]|uniref:DUF6671 domain-containing protein n=1 Tax=Ectopseudomonas hydrolytica TaxID=2493633 RepID=A0ABY5A1L4_9GAMM|nr:MULTISPECIES: DUF6671 family protein [Pseudomonas]MDH0099642.1 hypothetical protein [Pseudomonas sp. GD04158]USR37763.1 hypothetical protein L1F06_013775 [Pseudomonas hydrolytica]